MVTESGTPFFESQGYALNESLVKISAQAHTQWGYPLNNSHRIFPDHSLLVFNHKVSNLQHCLHGEQPGKLQASLYLSPHYN